MTVIRGRRDKEAYNQGIEDVIGVLKESEMWVENEELHERIEGLKKKFTEDETIQQLGLAGL